MFDLIPFRRGRDNMLSLFDRMEKNFMQDLGFGLPDFRTDIVDKGDKFVLEAELPGFDKKDINISVDDNRLTITAEHSESKEESKDNYIRKERRYGSFARSFDVSNIKTEDIKADYENGVLTLNLPKKDSSPDSRKIDIG
ncbi:MAG: Hsp20/alpha crystallin family protein [Candidatus Alkaliphilus sp. MAG34]|jgi:HSP20 family protein|nr:Hsp20/alpha crystallin family protein [Bacillota bacterium]NMA03373.1 Hsp20/alpha crystallin family protein [Clostridiales bacterium]